MKILFLDQFGDLGGAQRCLLDLLPELQARGWPVIVGAPDSPLLDRARDFGAITESLKLPNLQSGRKRVDDLWRLARSVPPLARCIGELVNRHAPTVIYANGPRVLPALAWLKPSAPCVFHSHNFIEQRGARWAAQWGINRIGANVIACCQYTASQWRGKPATVIYNGVSACEYRPTTLLGSPRIGMVGRVAKEKGHAIFLNAARALLVRHRNLRFSVVGAPLFGDAAAEREFIQLRAAAPSNVEFTGWVEDGAAAVAEMDLLIVPSIGAEATTRVIPEAWAAGVPVIANRIGGIAEIVEDGVNGFLYEPGSAQALASRIETVLALAPEQFEAVALAGRKTYEARFTLDRYRREVADLLFRIAAQQSPHDKRR